MPTNMTWLRRLFGRRTRPEVVARELRSHLDLEAEELRESGILPNEAASGARRALGNTTLIAEEIHDMSRWTSVEQFAQDLRYAVRVLAKSPSFTSVAVLTLSLGIGASTAIFSMVNGLLLRPLPYPDANRLVEPATIFPRMKTDRGAIALPDILGWKDQTDLFEAVAAWNTSSAVLTGAEEPERVRVLVVDGDYFRVMARPPLLGRVLNADDTLRGRTHVMVLTHKLWMRRFGGDVSILGRTVELSGNPFTVVGVMPKDSTWPADAEIIQPMNLGPTPDSSLMRLDNHLFRSIARLRPEVPVQMAQGRLTAMGFRIAQEHRERAGTNWKLHPLIEWIVGPTLRQTLWVLLGAVLFVLLIACVNVANLLLARGAGREREVAIRNALGAGSRRLARQFLVESSLLALAGGVAGVLLGYWGLRGLVHFAPPDIPRADEVRIDWTVLSFTAGLCLLTAIISGVAPALKATRIALVDAFREGGRGASGGIRAGRLRSLLVVAELALAIVLLTGAGLLIRSFEKIQLINPGFPARNLVTLLVGLPRSRYQTQPQITDSFARLSDSIQRIPGVLSASATGSLPLGAGGGYLGRVFLREAQPEPPDSHDTQATWSPVQPGYFRTMGIPITLGRAFTDHDNKDSNPVIIISQAMAQQMFPKENPLGRRIRSWRDENVYREIVGVAGDVRGDGLIEDINNNIYVPHAQDSWSSMVIVVRTQSDPSPLLPSIRREIWSNDSKLAISEVKTADRIMDEEMARPRFSMLLLGIFASTALLLAAIGIYGVMSYSVAQRTREIGIRMALGALRTDVLGMVASRALWLAAAGVICGVAGALALTGLMKTLLFGVTPTDLRTFVTVPIVLVAVTLLASYVPAWRASRVDPTVALRYE
jgi:putative ABC transport system permease protein